jgi:hypothetical protein
MARQDAVGVTQERAVTYTRSSGLTGLDGASADGGIE